MLNEFHIILVHPDHIREIALNAAMKVGLIVILRFALSEKSNKRRDVE